MEVASSPLFLQVQQRIHRTQRPRHLTQDEQAEVQFAWEKLAAGQPEVQARHVKMALRAMGFQVKKADVAELLQQHGLAPDGALGWQAFSEVLAAKITERSPQDEVRRAFQLFDLNRTGKITLKELSLIARQLQCDIEPQQLHDMISEFDADGDGAISELEFRAIMDAAQGSD